MSWRFTSRRFWVFSHIFVACSVILMVNLGFWQLRRLDDRRIQNTEIQAAMDFPAASLQTASAVDDLKAYRQVEVKGRFKTAAEADIARLLNRSYGGIAGEHVVAVLELDDGSRLAVNRGFVPLGVEAPAGYQSMPEPMVFSGWVGEPEPHSRFGSEDMGSGKLMARMDSELLEARTGENYPDNWLFLSVSVSGDYPIPVTLPELNNGPHLGYAIQWFIFSALTMFFYAATLVQQSRRPSDSNKDYGFR